MTQADLEYVAGHVEANDPDFARRDAFLLRHKAAWDSGITAEEAYPLIRARDHGYYVGLYESLIDKLRNAFSEPSP